MTTIPTELKHKPVIVVNDYENIDGRSAYNSDAKGLSLGLAQWNQRGNVDVSAKVWRKSGKEGHWSRLSEELPIHRVLDLAILFIRTKQYIAESYRYGDDIKEGCKKREDNKKVIERLGLQGDAMTIEFCTENEQLDGDVALFLDSLTKDNELIGERLNIIKRLLNDSDF